MAKAKSTRRTLDSYTVKAQAHQQIIRPYTLYMVG
ncbi:hypothetical protein CASFOL_042111 [Castilleja foliolosa]|uniref:Uncharacterized protein n=1 Tax=Castilleja foliolosa TaxID=1961234 RepID=A0ABD3B9M3_9LAMI